MKNPKFDRLASAVFSSCRRDERVRATAITALVPLAPAPGPESQRLFPLQRPRVHRSGRRGPLGHQVKLSATPVGMMVLFLKSFGKLTASDGFVAKPLAFFTLRLRFYPCRQAGCRRATGGAHLQRQSRVCTMRCKIQSYTRVNNGTIFNLIRIDSNSGWTRTCWRAAARAATPSIPPASPADPTSTSQPWRCGTCRAECKGVQGIACHRRWPAVCFTHLSHCGRGGRWLAHRMRSSCTAGNVCPL